MKFKRLIAHSLLALLFLSLAGTPPVISAQDTGSDMLSAVGKSQAAELAREAHGGKVLSVEEVKSDGHTLYRVKLLLDGGRIKIVTVDASNGKIV